MGMIDDLAQYDADTRARSGVPAVRPPPVPAEQLRLYTPEPVPQLTGPQTVQRIAAPASVPAIQAPMYTPETPPQLSAPQAISQVPTASAQPPASGPIARAAGMAGRVGLGIGGAGLLAGGAAATGAATNTVASNPDYFASSIGDDGLAANIMMAARDNPAAPPQPQAIASTTPSSGGIRNVAFTQSGGASGDWEQQPQAIADIASTPGYDAEMTRVRSQANAGPISQVGARNVALPVDAPDGGQIAAVGQQPNPIAFVTYGGGQGGNGTSGALVTNKDGTQANLPPGQQLSPDMQQFNALNRQASQSQDPVSIIRGTNTSVAIPNPTAAQASGQMQEVPTAVASGSADAVKQYQSAQTQNAINAADPLGADTKAKLALENVKVNGGFGTQGQSGQPGAVPSVTGDEYLKTLTPNVANQVKALAAGKMAFPTGAALKAPYWQQMLGAVANYDPSFDGINYNARAKTRADFTSGKSAQSINAMNTVAGHLESLSDAADALNNRSMPAWNTVANATLNAIGDPRVKQFDATKKAVVDELTRVWRGNGGSEGDIKSWASTLDAANSPDQLHGVIGQLGELIGSKISALGEQYKQGMGTAGDGLQLVTPKTQKVFDKLKARADGQAVSTAPVTPTGAPATTPGQATEPKAAAIPKAAMEHLRANPNLRTQFETKYGAGSAASVLGVPGFANGGIVPGDDIAEQFAYQNRKTDIQTDAYREQTVEQHQQAQGNIAMQQARAQQQSVSSANGAAAQTRENEAIGLDFMGEDPQELGYAKGGLIDGQSDALGGGTFEERNAAAYTMGRTPVDSLRDGSLQAINPDGTAGDIVRGPQLNPATQQAERQAVQFVPADYGGIGGSTVQSVMSQSVFNQPKFARGGKIVGPGTGTSDSIPAVVDGRQPIAVSAGEFIIPEHVVKRLGTKFFDDLIAKHQETQ